MKSQIRDSKTKKQTFTLKIKKGFSAYLLPAIFLLLPRMKNEYIRLISDDLSVRETQVLHVSKLLDEGATIPFIARYRKEATGNLDRKSTRLNSSHVKI